jgi:glyoxylase-like metal-dependent hydrolase (beta-lactamase superfamily II)
MIHYPHEIPPAAGQAILVAPGIYWIRMPLPFKLDHINLWLLEDNDAEGEGWTLVDTGYGAAATHALWEGHFAETMRGLPVKRIIVTHFHPDHVGCAGWLHQRTGAPLWMTATEFLSAHAAADDTAGFDRANTAELFVAHGIARLRPDFAIAQQTRDSAVKRGMSMLPRQFRRLSAGESIRIGQRDWRVMTVFGHAPEHAVFFSADDNILISGDQVLPRITTNVGVWGNQPVANPLKQFLDSMAEFAPLPAETLVLPSHDRVFTGLHARLDQLREHHQQRLAELERAIAEPISAAEILSVLFRRELDDHQLVFALGEAIAHLHYLWYAGRAARSLGADGVYRFSSTL